MILYDHLFTVIHLNLSIETDLVGKQCRPTSNAALPNFLISVYTVCHLVHSFLDSSRVLNRYA